MVPAALPGVGKAAAHPAAWALAEQALGDVLSLAGG